jgi:hypothetical protein
LSDAAIQEHLVCQHYKILTIKLYLLQKDALEILTTSLSLIPTGRKDCGANNVNVLKNLS